MRLQNTIFHNHFTMYRIALYLAYLYLGPSLPVMSNLLVLNCSHTIANGSYQVGLAIPHGLALIFNNLEIRGCQEQ